MEKFNYKTASKKELRIKYDEIAKDFGDSKFFTKKELNYLPEVLMDGEQVYAFTSGLMDNNTWLIILTDKRIIFLDKGMIFGLKQVSINLNKINAISGSTGLMFGSISIEDGANNRTIKNVWKQSVKLFTNKAQEIIEEKNSPVVASTTIAENPYTQLEKLSDLKDKGIVTQEEFEINKKRLLGL